MTTAHITRFLITFLGAGIGVHVASYLLQSPENFSFVVTLRLELGLFAGAAGLSFAEAYTIVPWSCWVVNLIIAEWFIIPRLTANIDNPGLARLKPAADSLA